MPSPAKSRALIRLAPALRPHLPGLVDRTVTHIVTKIASYGEGSMLTRERLHVIVRDNFDYLINHEPGADDPWNSPPRQTGDLHAHSGIPLPDVLSAYRVGFAMLWETITQLLMKNEDVGTVEVIEAATEMWWRADHFGQDVTDAYRNATTEILLRQEHERSAMVEALIAGTIVEQPAVWETASRLDIPETGHLLVAVAVADPISSDPIPGVVAALREIDIASAWRLAPHQAVGLLSLPDDDADAAMQCMEKLATGRVGISSVYKHLAATPRAYYLASVALRSRPRPDVKVRRFDDTPIAALVAAAPDAAAAIAHNVLGPVLALPPHDRDTLLDTFETWLQCSGSVSETAARAYCHPNTVRYRLHKLAEHTGRLTEDPAAASELSAALQAWRLVGQGNDSQA
jgi:hypothetical protein